MSEGYSYDQSTGEHAFCYREWVISLLAVKPQANINLYNYTAAGGVAGFVLGGILGTAGSIILMIAGAAAAYHYGKSLAKRRAPPKLTGKRDPENKDLISDFSVRWRCDADGLCHLERELEKANSKPGEWRERQFRLENVASVERRSLAEVRPTVLPDLQGLVARPNQTKAQYDQAYKRLHEASRAQMVIVVFDNGTAVEAGWQQNENDAAVVQSELRRFFGGVETTNQAKHAATERLAKLDPGDAPL